MAIGPINYAGGQAELDVSPLYALAQQLELRKARKAQQQQQQQMLDLKRAEAERIAAAEASWQADVEAAFSNPTTENYQRLFRHTDKLDAAKTLLGNYSDEQRKRNLGAAVEVGGLLNAGNSDLALKRLQDRRQALINGGESTEVTDAMIADIESRDPARLQRAKATAGAVIAFTDPEKSAEVLDRLGYSEKVKIDREQLDETKRHNRATEGVAAGNLSLSQQREGRIASDAKKSGSSGSGGGSFEYRIGPDGALQRRRR